MTHAPAHLDGWKEIAHALGVGVRTAQRWEREAGLPVHRLPGLRRSQVRAVRAELDAWRATRGRTVTTPARVPGTAASSSVSDGRSHRFDGVRHLVRAAAGLFLVWR